MDRDYFAFTNRNKNYRKNPEEYDKLFVNVISPAKDVKWIKVKAHSGILTLKGNKGADKLASAAINPFKVAPSTSVNSPVQQAAQHQSSRQHLGPPKKKQKIN